MITSIYVPKNKKFILEDASVLARVRGISLSELIVDLLNKETSKFPNLLRDMRAYEKATVHQSLST